MFITLAYHTIRLRDAFIPHCHKLFLRRRLDRDASQKRGRDGPGITPFAIVTSRVSGHV